MCSDALPEIDYPTLLLATPVTHWKVEDICFSTSLCPDLEDCKYNLPGLRSVHEITLQALLSSFSVMVILRAQCLTGRDGEGGVSQAEMEREGSPRQRWRGRGLPGRDGEGGGSQAEMEREETRKQVLSSLCGWGQEKNPTSRALQDIVLVSPCHLCVLR